MSQGLKYYHEKIKKYISDFVNSKLSKKIDEAPNDGKIYGRENKTWNEIPSVNTDGISTALDNNHYSVLIDGREYRCTKIGNQLWMSENLDAEVGTLGTSEETEGANEWYYNYDEAFAKSRNYGRLYTWDNLNENLAGKLEDWGLVTEDGKGWHLPSKEDFEKLMENIGEVGEEEDDVTTYPTAGNKLKSINDWLVDSDYKQGYNRFGFSSLPGGLKSDEYFNHAGTGNFFWSSTSFSDTDAYVLEMFYSAEIADILDDVKNNAFSVRCVLDLNPDGTIPDDFKSFVKIKSASAAENLVQSNTIHTPGVFTDSWDDTGTPISQVFEQYKTSGSLRVLMKDNSDIEVVCEANVDIIHASAGDTMMLWIDNPDVPNGKIQYELDESMMEWPEPVYYEIVKRTELVYIDSSEWQGSREVEIENNVFSDFGEVPAAVTDLNISANGTEGLMNQAAFQFTLETGTLMNTLHIAQCNEECKYANMPETFEAGKTYQVTIVNGCAVVGVFA